MVFCLWMFFFKEICNQGVSPIIGIGFACDWALDVDSTGTDVALAVAVGVAGTFFGK